jgi:hypothetical protein
MRGFYFCLPAFFVPFASMADCAQSVCANVHVDQLYAETGLAGRNYWIRTSGTETNLNVCAPDSGAFLRIDGSLPQAKETFALLMMAYSLDKPISIRVQDGSRGCEITFVTLDR